MVYAENAESALRDAVGFAIPLKGLESWIRGLPMKKSPYSTEQGDDGRLKSVSQNDWQINYLDYFERVDAVRGLPRKIYLKHDLLALKLVIEHWQKPLEEAVSYEPLFPSFD